MTEEENTGPEEPTDDSSDPRPPAPGKALPPTIYVWVVLLVLGFFAPLVLERPSLSSEGTPSTAEGETLSAQGFERYADAERALRSGFADDARLRRPGFGELFGGDRNAVVKRRQSAWKDALATYRLLAKTAHAPNVARRILILEHVSG